MANSSTYIIPQNFTERLETLQNQLPAILDDFEKYFVFYNKNPDNNEYQQAFQGIQGNLNGLNSQLFMLANEVQSNTNKMNITLSELYELINDEKKRNINLKKQLGNIEGEKEATTEMINNYKETYNNGYLRNWGLLLSIAIAGFAISKVYTNKIATP